ncbi:MAG: copper transporter [Sporichthyaceae bacterium]
MIDFRYHLVSLVAVFMALATGILVGSSLLNQSLIDSQRSTISSLDAEKAALRRALDSSREQLRFREEYLRALEVDLLGQRLAGRRVVLVLAPDASGNDADALDELLIGAGAQVSGQVRLDEDFFATKDDPRDLAVRGEARDAIVRARPISGVVGVPGSGIADTHLAAALLSPTPGGELPAEAKALLADLDRADFVDAGSLDTVADLAVVLVGPTPEEAISSTDRTRRGVITLAAALDATGSGVVVAGPLGAAVGGALDGVRRASQTSDTVSTVDTVDSIFGRMATALALVEQLGGGAGNYGANADTPLPDLGRGGVRR